MEASTQLLEPSPIVDPGFAPDMPKVAPPSPHSPRRRIWLWIGATAVIAAAALIYYHRSAGVPAVGAIHNMPTGQVRIGTLERALRLTGSTLGENSVMLLTPYLRGSRTRGGGGDRFHLVLQQLIADGSRVAEGDVVATFDRVSMLEQIDDLRADLNQGAGNLAVLAANLAANREARNQQIRVAQAAVEAATLDLRTATVRTAIQADMFRLALEEARMRYARLLAEANDFVASQSAQLRAAQLNVQAAELEVRHAEANAERMVVRAPRSGLVVTQSVVRNGEYATIRAGDELHAGQPYINIVAPGAMIVETSVNQVDVRQLRIGASAVVSPEAFPEVRLQANVVSIGTIATSKGFRGNFVRDVPVRLKISGSDPRVLPSLTVTVDLLLERVENVPLVSRAAVFSEPPNGSSFAFVQSRDSWEKRILEVGLANHTTVAVVSGLNNGDIVALERTGIHLE